MGRDGGSAANPSHLSVNQVICHCEELSEYLNEIIDILSDEAIFTTDLLSLVTAIKQYYIFNATTLYFGSLRNQSIKEIPQYNLLITKLHFLSLNNNNFCCHFLRFPEDTCY